MNFFTVPKLYKKTSTGAIQYWQISVYEDSDHSTAYIIETEYGQLGTDSPQRTFDAIYEGKNKGKKNETSVREQAESEALAKWKKQKKKGYVESIEAAQAEELDELIEGGVVPMLAHKFADHGHKIKYPAAIQPKLDGIRCIAMVRNGRCTLWSRTRKPITSMPHIVEILEKHFGDHDITLDGELYNHAYKTNFEHIVSLVRQEEPDPQHTDVQYHVYDLVEEDMPFEGRIKKLNVAVGLKLAPYIIAVETAIIEDEEAVMPIFHRYRAAGFEGAMLRNLNGKYVNKRSYDLLKVKEFDDAEFPIIGIEEGRGKLQGHVGSFICRTPDGKEFLAKMSGDTERLRDYFKDHSLWEGKLLTVKYQGLTGAEQVPRFPVGVTIRDYE
jgi:DNA ligase-1